MNTTCIINCHHTDGVILGIQKISHHLKIDYSNYQSIDPRRTSMQFMDAEIAFDKIHCSFIEKLLLTENRNLFSLTGNIYTSKVPLQLVTYLLLKNLSFPIKIRDGQDIISPHYFSILFWKFKLIH